MLSPLPFEAVAFVLGLLFGSFLNVCISRLPHGRSVITPRSECPQCAARIRWYDNIPIISWIFLRRRCRDCKAKIPWRYPLVELSVGIWFCLSFTLFLGARLNALASPDQQIHTAILDIQEPLSLLILGFLLIGLLVMDWQTHKLPDAFTLSGIAIGFFLVCVQAVFLPSGVGDIHLSADHQLRMSSPGSMASQGNVFLTGAESLVFGRIAAICAAGLLLWLVGAAYKAVRNRPGLGFGDVKLLAMIAAFLGFWPAILSLFLALIFALPYALYLIATKRADRATALPFGSFLCAGGLLAALFGVPLIAWYSSLL